jgi:hypothetical protein
VFPDRVASCASKARGIASQRRAQAFQPGQRLAQAGQVARAGVAQCDAPGNALDVGDAFQFAADIAGHAAVVGEQCFDGAVAGGRNVALAQRVVQRVAQQARTHAGHAVVEQREKRRRRLAAQGFGQFQIAPGGEIEAKVGAFEFHGQRPQMRQAAGLRGLAYCSRAPAAAIAGRRPSAPKPASEATLNCSQSRRLAVSNSKYQSGLSGAGSFEAEIGLPGFRMEDFGRADAFQRSGELIAGNFGQDEFAAGQVEAGEPGVLRGWYSAPAARHRACRRSGRHRSACRA